MKIEKLSEGRNKKIILSTLIITLLIGVIYITNSKAKYQVTESVQIVNGKINYTLVDFELAEINIKELNTEDYINTETIPDGNYELNEQSYCTEKYTTKNNKFEDVKNTNLTINFDKETKTISISPYSKKGTKCYIYLDKISSENTLMALGIEKTGDIGNNGITGTACDNGTDGSGHKSDCKLKDTGVYGVIGENDETSYVYRGSVNNNWVKFGQTNDNKDIWWRIIRINENGTIRLIYSGVAENGSKPTTSGTKDKDGIWSSGNNGSDALISNTKYNKDFKDNKYVGFMYGGTNEDESSNSYENAHSNEYNSLIKIELETWYNTKTKLKDVANKIDGSTGFCNDREIGSGVSGYGSLGFGNNATVYAPLARLYQGNSYLNSQNPTLKCKNKTRDLFTMGGSEKGKGNGKLTVPVGLITMDEVIYAGGFGDSTNWGYWLWINNNYWTMSPYYYYYYSDLSQSAYVFLVTSNGYVGGQTHSSGAGVRPVINLKADVTLTAPGTDPKGSINNPYIVS